MCKCISELNLKMIGTMHKNKKVIKAEYISAAFIIEKKNGTHTPMLKSTSEIELTLEGRTKPVIQNMVHTYCPFCGEKY